MQSALQDRFGEGHFLHPKKLLGLIPWGVVHDMSWGLFGRIPVVQDRLGPKWGGEVLAKLYKRNLHPMEY